MLTLDELKTVTTIPNPDLYPVHFSEIETLQLMVSIAALENIIVAKKLYRRPDEKNPEVVYWFSPGAYQYLDMYGKVCFLKENMKNIYSDPDAAYSRYEALFKAFFTGFDLKLEKTTMEYDYKVRVKLNFE